MREREQPLYEATVVSRVQVYEPDARNVSGSGLLGFVEVEGVVPMLEPSRGES